jgi:hypothetical protein
MGMAGHVLTQPSIQEFLENHHPSITLVAAGASGFLTLIQSGERPER